MSLLSWIHISDIHFADKYEPKISFMLPSFLETLKTVPILAKDENLSSGNRLLFITGDLTFSGSDSEFAKVLEVVIKPILKSTGIKQEKIFICPGNHEIIRDKCQARIIRSYLQENEENVSTLFQENNPQYQLAIQAFSSYKSFHEQLTPSRILRHPGLFFTENLRDLPISIVAINTGWAGYGGKEDLNALFIGSNQLAAALKDIPEGNVIITMCHHPITIQDTGWFADKRDNHLALTTVEKRSSFIFSGHVHKPDSIKAINLRGNLIFSQAGAFFEDEDHPYRPLSFSAGWLDTDSSTYRMYVFKYETSLQEWRQFGDSEVQTYSKTPSRVAPPAPSPSIKFPAVRHKDYESIFNKIATTKNSTRIVWVKGIPGIGKTTFSFGLSDVLFDGHPPIYIKRGDENDPNAIASAIRAYNPDIWFEAWKKYGKSGAKVDSLDDILEIITHILFTNRIWLLLEGGEQFNPKDKFYLYRLLSNAISVSGEVRIVVTTRQKPEGISEPPHIIFELDFFKPEDTKSLIGMELECSDTLKVAIHERFHGHPFSIKAFLAQIKKTKLNEDEEHAQHEALKNIPTDTSQLFENIWKSLSAEDQRRIIAICDIPALGIPSVVSKSPNKELEQSGLLSTYPSSLPEGVRFYIHPLVNEVCSPLIKPEGRAMARFESLEVAYNSGILTFGPSLLHAAIESGNLEKCRELLKSDGRAWIEVAGISSSAKAFELYLKIKPDDFEILYLSGLCALFTGEFDSAESYFIRASKYSTTDSTKLLIRAEIMECARRRGNIFEAFNEFLEIYPRLSVKKRITDNQEAHFLGVAKFLSGNLLRTLGAYEKAAEMFSSAELHFLLSNTLANAIERMHCQYSRVLCELYSKQSTSVDLRDAFATSTIKSDFLFGLATYLHGASLMHKASFAGATEQIKTAASYFRKFCSIAYESRTLCMLGIISALSKDIESALGNFSEVTKRSRKTSPQYLFANAMSLLYDDNYENNERQFILMLSELLKQGKLATAATLLKVYANSGRPFADFSNKEINCNLYLLDTTTREMKIKRIQLSTVKDALRLLQERFKITNILNAFPIVN